MEKNNNINSTAIEECKIDLLRKEHHHGGKSSECRLDKATIVSLLEISPGQIVLDAGCGNGYMSKEFSAAVQKSGKVYAIDSDELSIAALKHETDGTNIDAIVGDITTTTQLCESSVDIIYLSMVFHGLTKEQIKGFNREVNRILKPYGRLAIVEIAKRKSSFGPPLEIRFSPEELTNSVDLAFRKTIELGEYYYLQIFEKHDVSNN